MSRRPRAPFVNSRPRLEELETRTVPSLVAAFGFEESAGTTATDSSGQNNTGTLAGPVRVAGKFGQGLSFDGVNDWVTIANSTSLNLTTGMTLEAWVRPSEIDGWETVLLKEASNDLSYALYADNNGNDSGGPRRPGAWVRMGNTTSWTLGTSQLAVGAWTHLATTYDGSVLRFYVNGTLAGSLNLTEPINTSSGALLIGGSSIWSDFFNGEIDEVRVYDHALTGAEIQADMNDPVVHTGPDATPPTVTMMAPVNNATVAGSVMVTASAVDNVAVVGVQFYLNGNPLGGEDTTAPYSVAWNTSAVTNGPHTLTAVARDAAGHSTTSAAFTVNVVNGAGVPLTINGAQRFQTIDGFGTNVNAHSWNNGEVIPALDRLTDELGATLFRVIYDMEDWESTNDNSDPNVPNWTYYNALYSSPRFQNLWNTIRYLNEKGITDGITLSFMGRAPAWMGGSVINTTREEEWVETIATIVYYARNTEQVQFSILDPLNETDWDGFEGPQVGAAQYTRLLHKLSVKLDAMGLSDVRFGGPNTASISAAVSSYMPALLGDPVVMSKIDHFALHDYAGTTGGASAVIRQSAYQDRNVWITETADPEHILAQIGDNASAVLMWEGFDSVYEHAILAGRGTTPPNDATSGIPPVLAYNTATGVYTPRPIFYQDQQIFKFVPPGSIRVGAVESNGNLTTYAFYHPGTGRLTIVGRNEGGSGIPIAASIGNLPGAASFEFYKTDSATHFGRQADVPVTNGTFSFTAPADSYFTLTTITDAVPPAVTNRTPAAGAVGVAQTAAVTATFSEPIQASTIGLVLKDAGGNTIAGTFSYNATARRATLVPAAALAGGVTYTATLSGAKDLAGNTLATVSWSFTTEQLFAVALPSGPVSPPPPTPSPATEPTDGEPPPEAEDASDPTTDPDNGEANDNRPCPPNWTTPGTARHRRAVEAARFAAPALENCHAMRSAAAPTPAPRRPAYVAPVPLTRTTSPGRTIENLPGLRIALERVAVVRPWDALDDALN